jgi:hypothetical protein
MNLSSIVTRIKLKLGLVNLAMPFDDIDNIITTIIQDITLPVFSLYFPDKDTLHMNLKDLELLERTAIYEKVLLPDFKTRKLIYVFDVKYNYDNLSGVGYYGGGVPLLEGSMFRQMILANAGANLMNAMIPKMSFKFEPPRVLYVYNAWSSSTLQFDLGFEHDKSLASIPETAREEFLKLAMLDVKENIYPTLKQYTEINTALGNINLKLDDWSDADNSRRDLLDKWDDVYHLEFTPMYYL